MIIRIFFLFFVLFNFAKGQTTNENESLVENGKASFYHDNFQGQETSNGENYNKNDFTAAHRTFPFNTFLLVTNKNEALVEFATASMDKQLFVSKYLVELPGKQQLEDFVKRELKKY